MKRIAKKKVESEGGGFESVMRSLFRSFAMLIEQAADGRPQLRGLRVAHDPKGTVSSQCTSVRELSLSCASTATACPRRQTSNADR